MRGRHWLALALLAASSLVAQLLSGTHYWWERVPAFYAAYGFLGCLVIIFVSKWLGKLFLQKDEDYYDRG